MARSSSLRVGLVIAIAIAIAAAATFSIGQGKRFLSGAELLEAHFRRINGLQTGAPVSLSGVNIGAVESIRFPQDPQANYVVVKLWVEGLAAPRVHIDSQAQIESMGLLGDKFLELTPGTPNAPAAEPGTILNSTDPIDYEAMLRTTSQGDFLANVVTTTQSLRVILDRLENGKGLLSELIRGNESGGKQLKMASLMETLDRLDRVAGQLEETLNRLNHGNNLAAAMLSNKTNGRRMMADLSSSAASLRTTSARLDQLTARLEKARGTLPQLVEDRQYAADLLPQIKQSNSGPAGNPSEDQFRTRNFGPDGERSVAVRRGKGTRRGRRLGIVRAARPL